MSWTDGPDGRWPRRSRGERRRRDAVLGSFLLLLRIEKCHGDPQGAQEADPSHGTCESQGAESPDADWKESQKQKNIKFITQRYDIHIYIYTPGIPPELTIQKDQMTDGEIESFTSEEQPEKAPQC